MKIVFRRATYGDEREVCRLLKDAHESMGFADLAEFDVESTLESIKQYTTDLRVDLIVAEDVDKSTLAGLIIVVYQTPYFNNNVLIAYGLTIWVDPAYAKAMIGRKLFKRGQQLAKERGAILYDVGVRNDNPALVKFHKRYGAVEHETILRKRLN